MSIYTNVARKDRTTQADRYSIGRMKSWSDLAAIQQRLAGNTAPVRSFAAPKPVQP